MAKSRASMEKTKQIRSMIERGYSRRAVKSALRISQKTLKNALGETLHPGRGTAPSWASGLDWTKITDEIHRRGTTVKQLHQEYASDVNYLSFWRVIRERCAPEPQVSMRLVFKPGERTQIDFTDGILVHDRSTGQARKTQLFVGVLARVTSERFF